MRPSMVMPKQPTTFQRLLGLALGSVKVEELATSALVLAGHGHPSQILENNDLVMLGKQTGS